MGEKQVPEQTGDARHAASNRNCDDDTEVHQVKGPGQRQPCVRRHATATEREGQAQVKREFEQWDAENHGKCSCG